MTFDCKECSTCINGETEDTDTHFMLKDFTQDACIMYLQANGWLVKHDREITLGERNRVVDETTYIVLQNFYIALMEEMTEDNCKDCKDARHIVTQLYQKYRENIKEPN